MKTLSTTISPAIAVAFMTLGLSATGSAGPIYAVDTGTSTIYTYTPAGVRTTFSTNAGKSLLGMGVDSSGDVYTAARDDNAIYKFTPAGVRSVFASISSPYGLAIDSAGDVYSSVSSGTIMKYTPAGVGSVFATGLNVGSLAFDANGNLYVGQQNGTPTIYEFAPDGTRTTFATWTGTSAIFGLAFDSAGDLFASDWSSEINEITPGGVRSVFATLPSQTLPTSLAFGSDGTLYESEVNSGVAVCCTQTINAFTPAGVESTFASGLFEPFSLAVQPGQSSPSTPEPSTLAMLAGGALMVALLKRRA